MNLENMSVLFVEDNQTTQDIVKEYMEEFMDIDEVVCANDGVEALELLETRSFCVVITDYDMPRMNGKELVENIKEKYPELPIILVTVYDQHHPQTISMKGKVEYIMKPLVDFHDLQQKIDRLCI